MRSRLLCSTASVCLILIACSCGGSNGASTPTIGAAGTTGPSATAAPTPTTAVTAPPTVPPATDPPGTKRIVPYWMRDCPSPDRAVEVGTCRVAAGEARLIPAAADVLPAVMKELLAGPNPAEAAAGMTSNLRDVATLNALSVEGDTAIADFNRYFETATTRPQVAQVVYTLTQFAGVTKVRFLIDHATNGATGVPAVGRAEMTALTPLIFVDTPSFNATVTHTVNVTGSARIPGGAVSYRIDTADGTAVGDGTSTVPAVAGARGPLAFTILVPPGVSGPVTLVIAASNSNPEPVTAKVPLVVA